VRPRRKKANERLNGGADSYGIPKFRWLYVLSRQHHQDKQVLKARTPFYHSHAGPEQFFQCFGLKPENEQKRTAHCGALAHLAAWVDLFVHSVLLPDRMAVLHEYLALPDQSLAAELFLPPNLHPAPLEFKI